MGEEVVHGPSATGEGHAELAEVRELSGVECVEQNPELWKQFNEVCDKEEKNIEQSEQDDGQVLIRRP